MTERYLRVAHPSKRLELSDGTIYSIEPRRLACFLWAYFLSWSHDIEQTESSGAESAEKPISRYEWITMRVAGPLWLLRSECLSSVSFANSARSFADNFRNDMRVDPIRALRQE
jgi:hypothetical protein